MACKEKCGFLDVCPAFTDYQNKTNPILNPEFHKYCMDSRNEMGYCPLYDHQIYILKVISEEVLKCSQGVRGLTVQINKLEDLVKTK